MPHPMPHPKGPRYQTENKRPARKSVQRPAITSGYPVQLDAFPLSMGEMSSRLRRILRRLVAQEGVQPSKPIKNWRAR